MSRFIQATVKDVRKETRDAVSFSIEVPEIHKKDFAYIQGQYLTFRMVINGEDIRRSYSICSSPLDQELRVAVKKVEEGKFSTWVNHHLEPGASIEVMPPIGHFYTKVNPNQTKEYVGFASGSGITPLMSIMKTILAVEKDSRFTLFYGNKSSSSIIFKEELEGLKNKYMNRFALYHLFSREGTEVELFHGRLDGEKCGKLCQYFLDLDRVDEFFLCGPGDMITGVKATLESLDVPKEKIHFELFTTPGDPANFQPRKEIVKEFEGDLSEVMVILDGKQTRFLLAMEEENILDAALKNGADVPYACKGAVCCTCKAKVTEGKVEMDLNYSLTEEEIAQGYVLTCQAHPVTEKVCVNFDY